MKKCFLYMSSLITTYHVIPAKAGIQKNAGFRVKPGMIKHTRFMSLYIMLFLCLCVVSPARAAEIRNLASGQEGDRAFVQYDLVGELGEREADVTVILEIEGRTYRAEQLSLSGDFGQKVKVGRGKRFTWDALKDFPAGFEGEATL